MIDTQQQYINLNIRGEISIAGTLGQEKRYMHINVHTLTHIYMRGEGGGMRENIYILHLRINEMLSKKKKGK